MALAPPLRDDERGVGRVQREVHTAVRGVDMADLAAGAAGGVERLRVGAGAGGGEIEGQAVLFETRDARAQTGGVGGGQAVQGVAHGVVHVRGGFLVGLALRGDAGDVGAGAGAVGEGQEVGGCGAEVWEEGRGDEGVAEGEEAEVGDAEVAGEGAGGAAGAEGEELVVVAVDEAVGGEEEGEEEGGVEQVVELWGAGEEEAFQLEDWLGERDGCCCC